MHKVINIVYGAIGGVALDKETNTLFDFISSEFKESNDDKTADDNEKSVASIFEADTTK